MAPSKNPPSGRNAQRSRPTGDEDTGAETVASILIIEDDLETASDVVRDLTERGYEVTHASTGPEGLNRARHGAFDMIIVDRMLAGGLDGLEILDSVRLWGNTKPVLILSALGKVDDRVAGLRAGGDDYLTKPFALDELAARIEALLRRPSLSRETRLKVGQLELDLIERRARRGKREIELLPREFKLLEYMMRRPGRVITRAMLLEDIWHFGFVPETNLIDVHIGKLRRKIDGWGETPMLHTIRRAGFMLDAPG